MSEDKEEEVELSQRLEKLDKLIAAYTAKSDLGQVIADTGHALATIVGELMEMEGTGPIRTAIKLIAPLVLLDRARELAGGPKADYDTYRQMAVVLSSDYNEYARRGQQLDVDVTTSDMDQTLMNAITSAIKTTLGEKAHVHVVQGSLDSHEGLSGLFKIDREKKSEDMN